MHYGDIDIGQHWLNLQLAAWLEQWLYHTTKTVESHLQTNYLHI